VIRSVYVKTKRKFEVEGEKALKQLHGQRIKDALEIDVVDWYKVDGLTANQFSEIIYYCFAEKAVHEVSETIDTEDKFCFAVALKKGQRDESAEAARNQIRLMFPESEVLVRSAKVYKIKLAEGTDEETKSRIKRLFINSVDSEEIEVHLDPKEDLTLNTEAPTEVDTLEGFWDLDEDGLKETITKYEFAMDIADLTLAQKYFKEEGSIPTITELKVLDTYWSDHCRHTTFGTILDTVTIEQPEIKKAYDEYAKLKKGHKDTLMQIATLGQKVLKDKGMLKSLDESEEVNACSVRIQVENVKTGELEDYLLMFKNETHNHPTEIEPFGGAATCLGGVIRDPLSGRSYVYQAMRVTGAGNPTGDGADTLEGKLPQEYITKIAAHGYSSYGNQIGIPTGLVKEIYDEGYIAKRLELGFVLGAAPVGNVIREVPKKGDVIILLGGLTGIDGIGGATGSSKEHKKESKEKCGAEVQKGNPLVESAIQRLFRKSKVATLIERCNDFGAGGVAVAVGELADSLHIYLDRVPKKYEGLDGTELAISESQERMAVVVDKSNMDNFIALANEENLMATHIADVTDTGRLVMEWNGKEIVNLKREFLKTNGAIKHAKVYIEDTDFVEAMSALKAELLPIDVTEEQTLKPLTTVIGTLNVCSQKGLNQMFDNTIGGGTLLMPYGGKTQSTEIQAMAAKIPVQSYETSTCTIAGYGFDPRLNNVSSYHMAIYSVLMSVAKVISTGGNVKNMWLTFQEFFKRLRNDPKRWGDVVGALLGALNAQLGLGIASIGGKDSMSGSFENIDVPNTLVSFAVSVAKVRDVVSPEFKRESSNVYLVRTPYDEKGMPDYTAFLKNCDLISGLNADGKILAASAVGIDGIGVTLANMAFGNELGVFISNNQIDIYELQMGSFIIETGVMYLEEKYTNVTYIGRVSSMSEIRTNHEVVTVEELKQASFKKLENVFPTVPAKKANTNVKVENIENNEQKFAKSILHVSTIAKVLIVVFEGTNCQEDNRKLFERFGANVDIFIFKNLTVKDLNETVDWLAKEIPNYQIVDFVGGFSAGDKPSGSGRFIESVIRLPKITEAINLLLQRGGIILGICNGFQALVKSGLLPFGEVKPMSKDLPTLVTNTIGEHISKLATLKVMSTNSPWMRYIEIDELYQVAISHGEGRFIANQSIISELNDKGQILMTYYGENPNGSDSNIAFICSPDGRIFGGMPHIERYENGNFVNANKTISLDLTKVFKAGVDYFK